MSPGRNVGSSATGVVTRPKVCVRLCDGRYFPVQRHSGVGSAKSCSSFCPASATKIYNGNSINHAVAVFGAASAFVYRERIIPGCTCNGRRTKRPRPSLPSAAMRDSQQTCAASSPKPKSSRPRRDLHHCHPSGRQRRRPAATSRTSGLRSTAKAGIGQSLSAQSTHK